MRSGIKEKLWREVGHPLIDHVGHRRQKGVIFSYAYDVHSGHLRRLIDFCDRHGLEFYISPDKHYYPGHTLEITIQEKKEENNERQIGKNDFSAAKRS